MSSRCLVTQVYSTLLQERPYSGDQVYSILLHERPYSGDQAYSILLQERPYSGDQDTLLQERSYSGEQDWIKPNIQHHKVLQHHRLPQDLSGPDQGSMVVECCTICSIYDSPRYSGSLPGHTPQGYGHSNLIITIAHWFLEDEVSSRDFTCYLSVFSTWTRQT